jgi:hypothetical protein
MKTALAYALVMVPAFISALPFAQVSSASGAGAKVSHTVIAASGTAAPAGGIYNGFSLVRRNARGQTAFRATLRGQPRLLLAAIPIRLPQTSGSSATRPSPGAARFSSMRTVAAPSSATVGFWFRWCGTEIRPPAAAR